MSDYAKLIGELYLVASQAKSNNRRKLLERAADAIEQLSNAGREESKPKWIPVTERLPNKPGKYLVFKAWDYGYGSCHSISVVSYTLNLHKVDEYDFHGKEYKRPGWFDYDSEYGHYETGRDITHWMPLPTPPKEET